MTSPTTPIGPEAHNERAAIIETLAHDPSIYHSIDWWRAENDGHGIHFTAGPSPVDPLIKANNIGSNWQSRCERLAEFSSKFAWHAGEGVVGELKTPEQTAFVLYFQPPSRGGARPDTTLYTVVPHSPDLIGVVQKIKDDPSLLKEAFSTIAPEEIRDRVIGVRLVSDTVIDLQSQAVKPKAPVPAQSPSAEYAQPKHSKGFLGHLFGR